MSFVTQRWIVPTAGLDEAREARDVVDRSWRGLFFFWEETPRGTTAAATGLLTVPIMGKSDHIVEESLLHGGDVESHGIARPTRGSEDYIALPEPAAGAAESSEEGTVEYGGPERPSRRVALVLTICCAAAVLLGVGGFVSFNVINPNRGGLIEGTHPNAVLPKADGENEFYKASRTGYHFQPTKNWMNDPNAPMYYKGYYHLFYQYNPHGSLWGDIVWGHAVSTDLIHWQHLELAIMADQWYDAAGAWSGSATILKDGTPAILYTGARDGGAPDGLIQTQELALPEDPSDPLLRKWKKVDNNPIIVNPASIKPQDFRDPTTAWLEDDGLWRIVVGAKRDNPDGTRDGFALLYQSADFQHWDVKDQVLHEVKGVGMWECVDFFPVLVQGKSGLNSSVLRAENYVDTYKYVLKASMDDTRHDNYAIGTYSTVSHTWIPDDPTMDVGLGYRYDYGKFYASKTFYDTKTDRRILWGWANESDSEQDDIIKGWASVMAIPRTLWLDGLTSKNLLQWPVTEVEALRGAKSSHENILLNPTDVVKVTGADGPQLDILVTFEKPDVNSVDGIQPEQEEFDCILPSENTLSLRILVDHSIVETFVQGGRLAITSRVYPTLALNSNAHVFLFNNGTTSIRVKSLDVYQMGSIKMTTL
ncbi:unnamed protein product [Calypogeia fissa]